MSVHNAGRSRMAAGWLRHLAGDTVAVRSAGTPRKLDWDSPQQSDVIITMGCGDGCRVFPGKRYEDWKLTDPAGQPIEVVRQVRDEIRHRVETLLAELLPAAAAGAHVSASVNHS